jgi:CMP-N-acetylneuraminate monooxygenase
MNIQTSIRPIRNTSEEELLKIPVDTFKDGEFIEFNNFFVGKINEKYIQYNRLCDHNGGLLSLNQDRVTANCPIHNWKLLLNNYKYTNGISKKYDELAVIDNNVILKKTIEKFPTIETKNLFNGNVEYQFNAHASFSISIDSFNLITDPWLIGQCFATGWWHMHPPAKDSIQRLQNSNLIYISHNHPDHLHLETLLTYCKDDQQFLIPNFESKSVENILRLNGFNNIIALDFMTELSIKWKSDISFKLVIVKSGDDRDDSSLLIYTQNQTAFFGVDTNMPNNWILPQCDLLFTSFAGGMSGFPMRIDNFNFEKKIELAKNSSVTLLNQHVKALINATKPKYLIPYAGYFTYANRDFDVMDGTPKNSPDRIIEFCAKKFQTIGINPITNPHFIISNNKELTIKDPIFVEKIFTLSEEYFDAEIEKFSSKYNPCDSKFLEKLGTSFLKNNYQDNLSILIAPTNEDFSINSCKCILIVDFYKRDYVVIENESLTNPTELHKKYLLNYKGNIEILRIREDSIIGAFNQGLPLEDLSIGFQISMFRIPNEYNFNFWNFFTNSHFLNINNI